MNAFPHAEAKSDREYPQRPIVGVAGIVVVAGKVLFIRRGRAPLLGAWSLPGGALKVGETMQEGVAREVLEETGLEVIPFLQLGTFDRIIRDEDGRVRFHYILVDWLCEVTRGGKVELPAIRARGDALEAAWVSRESLAAMNGLDEVLLAVIQDALARAEKRR